MHFRCPNCAQRIELTGSSDEDTVERLECPSCGSDFAFAAEDETQIADPESYVGHFRIRSLIGRGGFGQVYLARDEELLRDVALKMPWRNRLAPEVAGRFLHEARAAGAVRHENVVQVYEIGKSDGSIYIVSEYVDGLDLGRWMTNHSTTPQEAALLVAQVCDGVHAAHQAGVIHRDLKPGNILVDAAGRAAVTDFGLARRHTGAELTVTRSGEVFGTPKYMSPEQAAGQHHLVDQRSDIFSIGVVLYRLLTGRVPFEGHDHLTVLFSICHDQPVPPRRHSAAIPRDIETICLKCLEKSRSHRYETAQELADDLRRFADGRPVTARPIGLPERARRAVVRRPVTAAAVGIALVTGLTSVLMALRPDPPPVVRTVTEYVDPSEQPAEVRLRAVRSDGQEVQNARWVVLPLDSYSRRPLTDQRQDSEGSAELRVDWTPGDYLVVVDIPGYGFHEVYRSIPEDRSQGRSATAVPHLQWQWSDSDEYFSVPDIVVPSEAEATEGMVLLPGGTFQFGDPDYGLSEREAVVESFWLAPHEFTRDQLAELPGNSVYRQEAGLEGATAAWGMTWHQAVALAELAGCRLPTEREHEYAATNFGTTAYPADESVYANSAPQFVRVSGPRRDRMADFEVFGLQTDVLEWTSSGFATELAESRARVTAEYVEGAHFLGNHRIVRGGKVSTGESLPREHYPGTARCGVLVNAVEREIGFRPARSFRPAFLTRTEPE